MSQTVHTKVNVLKGLDLTEKECRKNSVEFERRLTNLKKKPGLCGDVNGNFKRPRNARYCSTEAKNEPNATEF